MLVIFFPVQGTIGISFLSRYKKPTFPSIMGSVFGFLRFSMILRKHFFTCLSWVQALYRTRFSSPL